MSQLYFKVVPTGYVQTNRPTPLNVDYSKRLPVYRVVNEFMNLEPRQESNQLNQEQKETKFYVDITPSSTTSNDSLKFKLQAMHTTYLQRRDQEDVQSNCTEDISARSMISGKDKQMSVQNMKASQVGTVIKAPLRDIQPFNGKTEKEINGNEKNQHRLLAFQLQKERILRCNLEKSYENLLQTLKNRNLQLSFEEEHFAVPQTGRKQKRAQTDRPAPINHENVDLLERGQEPNMTNVRNMETRSEPDYQEEELPCNEEQLRQYYQDEKWFQLKVSQNMQNLHSKMQKIDKLLLRQDLNRKKQEERVANIELDNTQLRKQLQDKHACKSVCSCGGQGKQLPLKEHMHYIFTIFMMFLCFAVFSKNRN